MGNDLKTLLDKHKTFQDKYANNTNIMKTQQPQVMVIACSDSRTDAAVLLQCDPGDIFVVRNVANIVPPHDLNSSYETSAALEFGICELQVKHLILLAHSQCGGIQYLLNDSSHYKFVSNWVNILQKSGTTDVEAFTKEALMQSHNNCLSYPFIKDKVQQQQLKIHKWFFNLAEKELTFLCDETNEYKGIDKYEEKVIAQAE